MPSYEPKEAIYLGRKYCQKFYDIASSSIIGKIKTECAALWAPSPFRDCRSPVLLQPPKHVDIPAMVSMDVSQCYLLARTFLVVDHGFSP